MLQLIYCLTGDDKYPPILDDQLDLFVRRMRLDVQNIIWEAHVLNFPTATQLFHSYNQLNDLQRAAIFLSPDGFNAIFDALSFNGGKLDAKSLEKLLGVVEHHLHPQPTRSSLGNCVDGNEVPEKMILGGTITVDFGSALCRRIIPSSPAFFSPFEPLTQNEYRVTSQKLHDALAEIDSAAPAFGRLIRNYTRTIFVRKVGTLQPTSEQFSNEIGGIRLRNVHLDTYTQDELVDDLIHESIHNFLSTFEYLHFPFVAHGLDADQTIRPVSPWSSRPIFVSAFIHAVFVYFGMMNYASVRLKAGNLPLQMQQNLIRRRNKYASGFLMPGRLSGYVTELATIDSRVLLALEWMEKFVISTFGSTSQKHRIALCAA